ncbi:hypothetical protein J6590_073025 [Homalodisca vitripennis]|nr:hypothetical protein J6590_073025 [Homalodisca vitripennis]
MRRCRARGRRGRGRDKMCGGHRRLTDRTNFSHLFNNKWFYSVLVNRVASVGVTVDNDERARPVPQSSARRKHTSPSCLATQPRGDLLNYNIMQKFQDAS